MADTLFLERIKDAFNNTTIPVLDHPLGEAELFGGLAIAEVVDGDEVKEGLVLFSVEVDHVLHRFSDHDTRVAEAVHEGEAHVVEDVVNVRARVPASIVFEHGEPQRPIEPFARVLHRIEFLIQLDKHLLADVVGVVHIVHLRVHGAEHQRVILAVRFGEPVSQFCQHLSVCL